MWSAERSQGFESRKIKYLLPRYTRGRGLEIGCGMEKAFPHFIGVDSGHHFGRGAADIVSDATDLSLFADESCDFVFNSHVLEHLPDPLSAINAWGRVIKPGGHLCIYIPSGNFYPLCGQEGANPDHKHDFFPGDIEALLQESLYGWDIELSEERGEDDEYSIMIVARKRYSKDMPKQPVTGTGKTCCVVRFGAIGDMLQAALVFPALKADGYQVTVMTTPDGKKILDGNPHIDGWYIVDKDQVPNNQLPAFWDFQRRRFDKWVQLSESIEGTLLSLPGRVNHEWSLPARKMLMKANYHEWTAALADVLFAPTRLFYPTPDEERGAMERLTGWESEFSIVWALAGSSFHKFSPHMDAVIARIMLDMPEAKVYLVGDEYCRLLEQGWDLEERVVKLSAQISIRETLALAQDADVVVGCETGVLNGVAFDEQVSKVALLSHSSPTNLTKHFVKTQALTPEGCDCYPCHRLHYNDEHCQRDEATGAAQCMVNISPARIYEAIEKVYRNWRKR